MSEVNVHDYCQNPAKYAGNINPLLQKYFDSQCAANNDLAMMVFPTQSFHLPRTNNEKSMLKASGATSAVGDIIDDISWKNFGDMIDKILALLTSPQFLLGIGEFEGEKYGVKATISILTSLLRKGFSQGLIDGMSELAEKGAAESLINASLLLTGMLREGLEFGVSRFAASVLLKSLAALVEFASMPVIEGLMMMFMIIGMLFDMWDPCGLNNYLDHDAMIDLTKKYNDAFKDALLTDLLSVNEREIWPIGIPFNQYYNYYLKPEDTAAQNLQFGTAMVTYLGFQQKDVNGNVIYWPPGGAILTNSLLQRYADQLSSSFLGLANNNRVVANWLDRHYYWVILVVFVVLLIFILFVFIK